MSAEDRGDSLFQYFCTPRETSIGTFRARAGLLEKYKEGTVTTGRRRLGVAIKYTPLQQVHDLHQQQQADVIALSGSR